MNKKNQEKLIGLCKRAVNKTGLHKSILDILRDDLIALVATKQYDKIHYAAEKFSHIFGDEWSLVYKFIEQNENKK